MEPCSCPYRGQFQSTLPRGERHDTRNNILNSFLISIHAPARGATSLDDSTQKGDGISIHAPARGATTECRQRKFSTIISIHAPARGATSEADTRSGSEENFNPRSREGSDRNTRLSQLFDPIFQSTLPRGERQRVSQKMIINISISIHAPARGATIMMLH